MSKRSGRPRGTSDRGRARQGREHPWARRVLLGLLVAVAFTFGAVALAFAVMRVPDPNELAAAQASIVYFDDGRTEMGRLAELNRESVPLSAVPVHVREAVLAAEDREFYTNQGVSPSGIVRSVWQAVRGGEVQGGGSTITQQYVKNYFLTQERTPDRKLREIVIALKVDQQRTKDEVLEGYLNTIYYGRGAYGIQAAAQAYFGKDAGALTVPEGAVLASVINAPSLFDPALGEKQAANLRGRFDYVLDGMVSQGWLTPQQRAGTALPQVLAKAPSRVLTGPNGYIVAAVRSELQRKLGLSEQDVEQGGLRITTTVNKESQDAAVAAVEDNFPRRGADDVSAGLVAVRPGDGAVVALYGGRDYQERQFSAATDAKIPAGSTFKPFGLVAALQKGISTRSTVDGGSPLVDSRVLGAGTRIVNEGGRSYGTVDLRRATASSINTAFVRLNMRVTPAATRDAAVAAGIPEQTPGLGADYTNVLGTASPSVWDMAGAYATIAAQGQRADPYLVRSVSARVVDKEYTAAPAPREAFGKDVAADVIDAMQQVTRSGGTAARAQQVGRPVAGKTGTSEERKSVWFSGFTPSLAVSVAMYKDVGGVPQPLTDIGGLDELSGNSFPLTIWIDFMRTALQGQPREDFPRRAGIGDSAVRWSDSSAGTSTPRPSVTARPTGGRSSPTSSPTGRETTASPTTPSVRLPTSTSAPTAPATQTPALTAPANPPEATASRPAAPPATQPGGPQEAP